MFIVKDGQRSSVFFKASFELIVLFKLYWFIHADLVCELGLS